MHSLMYKKSLKDLKDFKIERGGGRQIFIYVHLSFFALFHIVHLGI